MAPGPWPRARRGSAPCGRLVHIGRRRVGVQDQPRRALVTALGQVDHVASPMRAGLGPEPGIGVVGGLHPVTGTAPLYGPQTCAAAIVSGIAAAGSRLGALEVPRPHATQHGDRRQRRKIGRCVRSRQRIQQAVAIRTDPGGVGIALGPGLGQAHILDPPAVALEPSGRCQGTQPVGRRHGDLVQRGAQRLGQQFDPVQVAHGGQHVRAVGALPAPRLEQPALARRVQDAAEQALPGPVLEQSAPELAQDAVVKARVGQLQREQVLPVDPATDRLGGLPVAQPLAELHEGDEGQPPRGVAGLAERGVESAKSARGTPPRGGRAAAHRGCRRERRSGERAVSPGTGGHPAAGGATWQPPIWPPHQRVSPGAAATSPAVSPPFRPVSTSPRCPAGGRMLPTAISSPLIVLLLAWTPCNSHRQRSTGHSTPPRCVSGSYSLALMVVAGPTSGRRRLFSRPWSLLPYRAPHWCILGMRRVVALRRRA